jgi:hypothetical protein
VRADIVSAIYHALGSRGSDADYDNMMICDAQTNSLKTSVYLFAQ